MKRRLFVLLVLLLLSISIAFAGSQQTSSTPASTIITNVRAYLNEPTEGFWDDDDLLVWVNDGILDIVARTRCMQTTEDITLQTNTLEYSLSTDYIDVETAQYEGSGSSTPIGLTRIRPRDVGQFDPIGQPARYYLWNDKIGIDPFPGSGVSGHVVKIYLYERPSGVTTGQNIPTPAIYDRVLTLYVIAQALFRDRRDRDAEKKLAQYIQELDRYRADFLDRFQEPEEIKR